MSRRYSARRQKANHVTTDSIDGNLSPAQSPTGRLLRLAAIIATGESQIPENLAAAELSVVLAEVSRLRRQRLVQFIARAIALDIHRSPGP